ncbi:hypothetical protein L218DRAFT_357966 [Marasmius fiardii PR-910]|nr:hypothetical protein L218DRAFT_357966 [Marasmius fiardii PR-910]
MSCAPRLRVYRLARILQLFMDRSKSTSLSMSLSIRLLQLDSPTIELSRVLSESIDRCRNIELDRPPDIFEHSALGLLPSRLSSLQHAALKYPSHSGFRYINLFNQCPSLTSLEICHMEPPYSFERAWPTIKDLRVDVRPGSISLIAALLEVCVNVENLSISVDRSASDSPLEILIVVSPLRSLKVFEVISHINPILHYVLRSLSLPNLSTMIIRGGIDEHFADFLSHSNCNIAQLKLIPIPHDHRVFSFLRLLPSLEELSLDVQAGEIAFRSFLDQLSVEQECSFTPPLLPQLTDLTLILNRHNFEEEPLVRAVTSRWFPSIEDASEIDVACLRLLRLEVVDYSVPSLEPLLYLRDAGLRMDVFTV